MKRCLTGLAVLLALCTALLWSQGRASITGVVSDPAGAVLTQVSLELRNTQTNAIFTTASGPTGGYTFASVAPGNYELRVAHTGFKQYTAQLTVATANVVHNVRLEIGSATDSISVNAETSRVRAEMAAPRQAGTAKGGAMPMLMAGMGPPAPQAYQVRADSRGKGIFPGRPIPERNSEEYGRWVENEFASPTNAPLSTFGVDVDTASYANIRRFLSNRQLPPPDAVRIEELINYFSYDHPLPERGKPVSMTTHLTSSPWNNGRQLLHIALRTQPVATEDLPATHLTFLIDVSGSMSTPDKLPLVKQALSMLVRQLRAQDRVALVVYAGNSGVVLPSTGGDRRDTILGAIDRLEAGGSTHGSAGIKLAYKIARDEFLKNGNNRVILATDGDFNVGVTSDAELVSLIEDERKSGVFLSVLGFGTGNLKDSKMEKLADHGNGNYAYIDSLAEARKVFVQEMGATIFTVAKDVKLQIEFNPARVREYRLIGYENRLLRPEDFNDDTKDAGDLGAGHQVTAFYEIVPQGSAGTTGSTGELRYQEGRPAPPQPAGSHTDELGWIKLRYKAPQSDTSQLLEWPVSASASTFERAPRELRFAAAVAEYGILLRHSKFAGSASYEHALRTATSAIGTDLEGHRTAFLDLVRDAARLSGRPVR